MFRSSTRDKGKGGCKRIGAARTSSAPLKMQSFLLRVCADAADIPSQGSISLMEPRAKACKNEDQLKTKT